MVMKKFALTSALVCGLVVPAWADSPTKVYTFSTLKAPTGEAIKSKADAWLKTIQAESDIVSKFNAIWNQADRPALDRLADGIAVVMPHVGQLLADARDPSAAAPKELPDIFKDAKLEPFVKANLALVYARALSNKRVYEEALEAMKLATPELVVDPAAYYFHKAVTEHALVQKSAALGSINRLLEDVVDPPERYKMVAVLMYLDMQQWKDEDKDLENIARLMDNIERRLDLSRGGPQTQELQKRVLNRLDEVIKEIENQIKNGNANAQCPGGGQQPGQGGSNQPGAPQQDSVGGTNSGPGLVDPKKLKTLAENWGKLPEKERAKAMMEITKDLPPRYREVIENYFKSLAKSPAP
jgi:tetratricopeptide (TPR) repeat protein